MSAAILTGVPIVFSWALSGLLEKVLSSKKKIIGIVKKTIAPIYITLLPPLHMLVTSQRSAKKNSPNIIPIGMDTTARINLSITYLYQIMKIKKKLNYLFLRRLTNQVAVIMNAPAAEKPATVGMAALATSTTSPGETKSRPLGVLPNSTGSLGLDPEGSCSAGIPAILAYKIDT